MEVYAFLVGATVFKTGETGSLGLAGSIPVHLRHRPASALIARTARAEGLGNVADFTCRLDCSTIMVTDKVVMCRGRGPGTITV